MTAMTAMIHAGTLKSIRKARKVGRPKLAKLAGITQRQVAKLEASAGEHSEVPGTVMVRISDALQVPSDVLSGDVPATDADMAPIVSTKCTSGCCG